MRSHALIHSLPASLLAVTLLLGGCHENAASAAASSATHVAAPTGTARWRPAAPDPAPSPAAASGSATVSWDAPTQNTDGSVLTDLSGFRIYYGTDPAHPTRTVTLSGTGLLTYVVEGLPAGTTYYFAVTALANDGSESAPSAVVAKVLAD